MMIISRATTDDLEDVLQVLNTAAGQLQARGIDQWPVGFRAGRIRPYVARAEMWLVRGSDGRAIATARADSNADPDFWAPAEAQELAMYFSKLARTPDAPAGTGTLLLRWLTDHAAGLGYRWVRLDAWRTNTALHRYYLDRGWAHLRTVEAPGRRSGALFQRPAAPDPEARSAFAAPPSRWLAAGTRVNVAHHGRGGSGVITSLYSPAALAVVSQPSETDILPSAGYWVRLDDGGDAVLCDPDEVTADNSGAAAMAADV